MRITKEQAEGFRFPRWEELPALSLYMDQVLIVLEEALALFQEEPERLVTATMINNYVKQKLIAAPEKKKYGREQIAQLLVVSVLKKVLSMQEIAAIIALMTEEYGAGRAHDLFAEGLEQALRCTFAGAACAPDANRVPPLVMSAAQAALMGKLQVQVSLHDALKKEAPAPEKKPEKKKEEKQHNKKKQEKNAPGK